MDAATRLRRAVLAGHTGDEAAARALADDPDPKVRAGALGSLHRLGRLDPSDLRGALTDEAAPVRRRALEVVAALTGGGPAAEVSIVALLDDPDPTVVEMAAWTCGERVPAEPDSVARLMELALSSPEPLVREAAVAALGAIGDPTALPAVLAATTDRATVRRRAVIALAPFEGPEVDRALEKALTDRDWQVRQAAEDLIDPDPHP